MKFIVEFPNPNQAGEEEEYSLEEIRDRVQWAVAEYIGLWCDCSCGDVTVTLAEPV